MMVHPNFGVVNVWTLNATPFSCSTLKIALFHEHQHCTANVNIENETLHNQTESTSFKHSHGKVFNHVKTLS